MKKATLIKMIPFLVLLCLLTGISCSASQQATSFTRISMGAIWDILTDLSVR